MIKNVYEGKSLLFEGPYNITFKEGQFEVLGTFPQKDYKISIPKHHVLPVYIKRSGKIDVRDDYPVNVKEVSGNSVPISWGKLGDKIIKENINSVLIFGKPDSGKTNLINYLLNRLVQLNKSVGTINTGLSQFEISEPGSIGLSIYENIVYNLFEKKPFKFQFVGSFSQSVNMLNSTLAMKKIIAAGLMNTDVTLFESTGNIFGNTGRLMKKANIEMINPDLIILLQENNECEHLIRDLIGYKIFRASIPKFVRNKSLENRKFIREYKFKQKFKNSDIIKLSLKNIRLSGCFFNTGIKQTVPEDFSNQLVHFEKLEMGEGYLAVFKKEPSNNKLQELKKQFGKIKIFVAGNEQNLYVGLLNERNEYIGVGLIDKIDFGRENIYINTSTDAQDIQGITIGSVKLDLNGNEIGFLKTGTF